MFVTDETPKARLPRRTRNIVRVVTATSLFDGHDAAINIMRRIIQASGAEVIHLGHDRSVAEIVDCAVEEDAHAVAVTSYQGGHLEYFKYMRDLLVERGYEHVRIFGGGGGVIFPDEMKELHDYGITRIYSPDDGRSMGLQGMVDDLLERADFSLARIFPGHIERLLDGDVSALSRAITLCENSPEDGAVEELFQRIRKTAEVRHAPVLGVTGTGGAGKSSLIDEFVHRFLLDFSDKRIAILSIDPTKRKSGGALLGDRIRMNAIHDRRVFMRSLATRQTNVAVSKHVTDAVAAMKAAGFDLILLETSGIGQSGTEVVDLADVSLYVMTPDYGAATQLEKIDMIDFADVLALNKFDRRGAQDALRDVRKQFKRSRNLFDAKDSNLPVIGTTASQFNDPGMNHLYRTVLSTLEEKCSAPFHGAADFCPGGGDTLHVIPPDRTRYLAEITDTIRKYDRRAKEQVDTADRLHALKLTLDGAELTPAARKEIEAERERTARLLDAENLKIIEGWDEKKACFEGDEFVYQVRGKEVRRRMYSESLSRTRIPKVALPSYRSFGEILRWSLQENVPGEFPFTAGVFPLKREEEDPTRMFAGEGGPEKTNRRFHYLSYDMSARRLSTAFDSVTLYGNDPDLRPDIYGKIGNSGVSVCCLDDAKKLYSGFDLCDPKTSVSMTINGPAPFMLGFFLNAAIDQQCEKYIRKHNLEGEVKKTVSKIFEASGQTQPRYNGDLPKGNDGLGLMLLGVTGDKVLPRDVYEKIKAETLGMVRGTVQADILKEDQAQNTCIFSTEFALRLMGDVQEYFSQNNVRNFYSVSISGYHIAEAGANPISQLAFTLANGFTYVEYYLHRGMKIDEFAPNLSFFFSNGIDPEYAVIGRVARRIWAKAMRLKYGANTRSQMLKYHIQTSGRSLHAQEISFNDIRTTLQAVYAIFDHCNSLHTNAYDEAITTPTEESVRRAMAIQLIINHELGLAKNQNPWQGSFIIEKLTDLVEGAVLEEFDRISERGGVLGAMETMYQRGKIQEESLYYESMKHSGEYPIMGVNTFLAKDGSPTIVPQEVRRSTSEEKDFQVQTVKALRSRNDDVSPSALKSLQMAAVDNTNVFDAIMETAKVCSLGQMARALYEVGGRYRRNM